MPNTLVIRPANNGWGVQELIPAFSGPFGAIEAWVFCTPDDLSAFVCQWAANQQFAPDVTAASVAPPAA